MNRSVVKSASRTLRVLELFSEYRRPLRLFEICDRLECPQSSATLLMKSLLKLGYVNYNRATRTYLPTNKVSSLGNWLTSVNFGQSRFHELAARLCDSTDESVAISSQNDLFIQYIILKTPDHKYKMLPTEGNMRLLTQSTSGVAILSRKSDRQIDNICRHINYCATDPADRVNLGTVMREVNWTRHVGYCYREDLPEPGIASLAFPLDETLHGIPLALGIGGFKKRLVPRISDLLEMTRQTMADFGSDDPVERMVGLSEIGQEMTSMH